jgi:hypothetical protein
MIDSSDIVAVEDASVISVGIVCSILGLISLHTLPAIRVDVMDVVGDVMGMMVMMAAAAAALMMVAGVVLVRYVMMLVAGARCIDCPVVTGPFSSPLLIIAVSPVWIPCRCSRLMPVTSP